MEFKLFLVYLNSHLDHRPETSSYLPRNKSPHFLKNCHQKAREALSTLEVEFLCVQVDKKTNSFNNEINLLLEQITKDVVDFSVLYSFHLSLTISKRV